MNSDPSSPTPTDDSRDLSGLGRTLLGTQPGSQNTKASTGPWQPPSVEELQKLLPQYEITHLLGRGGMGAVYQGRQISLDRPVAIKILSAELDDADLGFAERFKNEARAMAKLSHPGIVGVYDSGQTADGLLYIVMEFIEGTDVQQMISASKRLHTEHAMAITAHVCDALAYAHERGIIHRDIKPANIMVGYDGSVKVTDFGLAKIGTVGQSAGLTQSGMTMGTLHYMAPEVLILGTAVDQRADIYAVGVMLYQMLTGKLPQGMFELPSLQVPGLDPRYDGIIAKALRDDRERRYQSAMEMRHELDAILTQPVVKADPAATSVDAAAMLPTQARPQRPGDKPFRLPQLGAHPRPTSKSLRGWLIWAVLGVVALGGGYVWLNRGSQNRQTVSELPSDRALASTAAITPATATKDTPFVNSLGMKFVPVPGTGVLICIHETRHKDFAAYADAVSRKDDDWKNQKRAGFKVMNGAEYPVTLVNLFDCRAFCIWLSEKEGRAYRLPSDREWSTAVGIADREDPKVAPMSLGSLLPDVYPWGSQLPPPKGAGNYADSAWKNNMPDTLTTNQIEGYTDGFTTTAPVMSFTPNPLGLYDLGGNVNEWCEDAASHAARGIARGGSFLTGLPGLPSSRREDYPAVNPNKHTGFRVVVEIAAATAAAASSSPPPTVATPPSIPANSTAPATATKDKPFISSLGMKFVPVPGTQILMCIHETRYSDYAAYAADSPGVDEAWKNQTREGAPIGNTDDHPVVGVTWDDAKAFCAWLGKKEGRAFRLPTDREWSIAVGIGEAESAGVMPRSLSVKLGNEFPWGKTWPPPNGFGNYADISNTSRKRSEIITTYTDGHADTAPVMSFQPNPLGIHDLGGNVCEAVEDWMDATQKEHVWRGGSYGDFAREKLLSSFRLARIPPHRTNHLGFRCVVELASLPTKEAKAPMLPAPSSPQPKTVATAAPASSVPPNTATKDAPFTNTLGMKFVPVPGTNVIFGIHETRYSDYAAYAADSPGVDGSWKDQSADGYTPTENKEQHPVVHVSWEDAQKFCAWLSKKEGKTYRLPTDEEWSSAVGLGRAEKRPKGITPVLLSMKENTEFPWGGDFPPKTKDKAGNYSDESRKAKAPRGDTQYLDGYDDGFPTTAPVMSFMPNKFGIYDMGGNVLEWCDDWFDNLQKDHVLRGGSWNHASSGHLLSSLRSHHAPDARDYYSGFRCVLVVSGTPPDSPPSTTLPNAQSTRPAKAAQEPSFTNTLGMKFVPVSGTDVLFCIHETRYKDYAAYAAEAPGVDGLWKDQSADGFMATDRLADHPVMKVNWEDAQAFCAWLSKKEGKTYRLPTDEEWSTAVGLGGKEKRTADTAPGMLSGKENTEFPWGDKWPPPKDAGNYSDESRKAKAPQGEAQYLDGYDDGFPTTAPVMSFKPNKFGLYDLGGNVWEWCEDWYDYAQKERVLRGASWDHFGRGTLPSSIRHHYSPTKRYNRYGFRVVLELATAPSASSQSTGSAAPQPSAAMPSPIASHTFWIDAKGRTLNASFLRMEGSNVVLEVLGKPTPVALASLSAASQQIAQSLQVDMRSVKPDTGWVTLFPNNSFAGWTGDTGTCMVADGIVQCFGKGDIISPKEYGNFHIKFDLRLISGTNNGVGIWRQIANNTLQSKGGFEVSVQDDTATEFSKQEFWQRHGGLYYYQAPAKLVMGPVGSWNTHEIKVEGTRVTVTINNTEVVNADLTKLTPLIPRATPLDISRKRGHIVLEGRRGRAEFRNMQIKELNERTVP